MPVLAVITGFVPESPGMYAWKRVRVGAAGKIEDHAPAETGFALERNGASASEGSLVVMHTNILEDGTGVFDARAVSAPAAPAHAERSRR